MIFPEYNKKKALFYYGHKRQMRGVISHASFNTQRTDGKIEVLYMALRARHGYSMMKAYNICKQMHEVAKGNPLRYDNSGKQEDGQGAGWLRVPGVSIIKAVSDEENFAQGTGQIKPCPNGLTAIGYNIDTGEPICEDEIL